MDLIAAVDSAWAIGKGEKLLFSIPEDLHRFKELTLGGTLVYGRRTMRTFPGGKPLPGRLNYVLTHTPEALEGDCRGVSSVGELLELTRGQERVYLVGGESVYRQLLSRCAFAYITKVEADAGGDRFLENLDASPDWGLVEQSEPRQFQGLTYRFCTYENRKENL